MYHRNVAVCLLLGGSLKVEEMRECRICRKVRHIERFYKATNAQGKVYRRRVCAICVHRHRVKKRVPLEQVRPYVREIVHRCGSIRRAAVALETSPMVVRRWLGVSLRYDTNGRTYRDKRMNRETAARVLLVLADLRRGHVFYEGGRKGIGDKPPWSSVNDGEAEYRRGLRAAA